MARKNTPPPGSARIVEGRGVGSIPAPRSTAPVAQVNPATEPDALPALAAEMVQALSAAATHSEEVIRISGPVVAPAAAPLGPDVCPRYDAGTALAARIACPWERGRLADGTQVYRCGGCDAVRVR